MIYILEGCSGAGKTTFVNTLEGYECKKKQIRRFDGIKAELEANKDNNIVYDRLFMLGWLDRDDKEYSQLNEYLKSLPYVKCIKFETDTETSYQKRVKYRQGLNLPVIEEEVRERINYENERYAHIFEIMDVFEEA
jgi:cytidylate kinase